MHFFVLAGLVERAGWVPVNSAGEYTDLLDHKRRKCVGLMTLCIENTSNRTYDRAEEGGADGQIEVMIMADAPGISHDDRGPTALTADEGIDELISPGRIGWLTNGQAAVCDRCATPEEIRAPLFRIDVQPYRQTCARCATVLQEGAAGWPELFSRGQRRDLLGVHSHCS